WTRPRSRRVRSALLSTGSSFIRGRLWSRASQGAAETAMTRCPRCAEENPERARFCLNCGLPLESAAPTLSAEERKLVTAIFVDLVGSTAHAERHDPEDVSSRLRAYHDRLRSELERFGGTVEKFIGDAVVALFGAPIANEDDPERAVRAAFAVREA